ncbi:hypothetical protein E2C01_056348 [Portunus trituberculatus]|uniref:Uncharacterized protein n=1 Tax=Portunus trituberculatus TaxID=210409 RepID=A0A5B7GXV4_PORTR|nr:hypothetical protein [Portunus trituberculatus]
MALHKDKRNLSRTRISNIGRLQHLIPKSMKASWRDMKNTQADEWGRRAGGGLACPYPRPPALFLLHNEKFLLYSPGEVRRTQWTSNGRGAWTGQPEVEVGVGIRKCRPLTLRGDTGEGVERPIGDVGSLQKGEVGVRAMGEVGVRLRGVVGVRVRGGGVLRGRGDVGVRRRGEVGGGRD